MKVQYCSDLHLEFKANREFMEQHPIEPVGEILLLAGDIIPLTFIHLADDFFNLVSLQFEKVFWVPGNHEYYNYDIANKQESFYENIRENVFLVNNFSTTYRGINFIFSTLWTKISDLFEREIVRGVNDFHMISYKGERLTPIEYNNMHLASREFIKSELSTPLVGKTIVVTHHVPSLDNYPEKYKESVLNSAFAVDMNEIIKRSSVDYWIYGHHHFNLPDFQIENTKLVTNQVGYVNYDEHKSFRRSAAFDI